MDFDETVTKNLSLDDLAVLRELNAQTQETLGAQRRSLIFETIVSTMCRTIIQQLPQIPLEEQIDIIDRIIALDYVGMGGTYGSVPRAANPQNPTTESEVETEQQNPLKELLEIARESQARIKKHQEGKGK